MIFAEALTENGIREAMEHCPGGKQNRDDQILKALHFCLMISKAVYLCVSIFIATSMYVCLYVCMYVCMYACMLMYVCLYV